MPFETPRPIGVTWTALTTTPLRSPRGRSQRFWHPRGFGAVCVIGVDAAEGSRRSGVGRETGDATFNEAGPRYVSTRATVVGVERIGLRDLRNHTSGAIRRAMAGERIIITIDGKPAAQLGPLNTGDHPASIADLIGAGLLEGPRATAPPLPPEPIRAPGPSSTEILREHRSR